MIAKFRSRRYQSIFLTPLRDSFCSGPVRDFRSVDFEFKGPQYRAEGLKCGGMVNYRSFIWTLIGRMKQK